jgi:hypothetical protein
MELAQSVPLLNWVFPALGPLLILVVGGGLGLLALLTLLAAKD